MASRRSMDSKKITEDEIKPLISVLQALLLELQAKSIKRASAAATVIEEACNHIRRLHREIEGLSEKLAQLLEEAGESDSSRAEIIRNLLV